MTKIFSNYLFKYLRYNSSICKQLDFTLTTVFFFIMEASISISIYLFVLNLFMTFFKSSNYNYMIRRTAPYNLIL